MSGSGREFWFFSSLFYFFFSKRELFQSQTYALPQEARFNEGGEGEIYLSVCLNITYLHLIVPFWYALPAAFQPSLVEPWFVFWRDAVESKYMARPN